MIEHELAQYGLAGTFIAYLIFDRHVLLRKLTQSLNQNTEVMRELCYKMKGGKVRHNGE